MEIKRTPEISVEKTRRFVIRPPETNQTISCPAGNEAMLAAAITAVLEIGRLMQISARSRGATAAASLLRAGFRKNSRTKLKTDVNILFTFNIMNFIEPLAFYFFQGQLVSSGAGCIIIYLARIERAARCTGSFADNGKSGFDRPTAGKKAA